MHTVIVANTSITFIARLGYNAEDPERVDNNVDWKLNFATKSKCTELSFERKDECVWDGDVRGSAEKTVAKCKISHGDGDCVQNVTFANDKQLNASLLSPSSRCA